MDFRIDMGIRRSYKTTRLLNQAVADLDEGRVKFAMIVSPSMAMLENAKAMARKMDDGTGKCAQLFDKMKCAWITAGLLDLQGIRKQAGYYIPEPVGVYFDEGIHCMMADPEFGRQGFDPYVNSLIMNGLCVFSTTTPENEHEAKILENVMRISAGLPVNGKTVVLVKKTRPDARLPERAHADDAGADVFANSAEVSEKDGMIVVTYGTGLSAAVPQGKWLDLRPRSSVYKTGMWLCNSVGTIDAGYRGEIMMKFYCDKKAIENGLIYMAGDKIGQLVVMPDVSPLDVEFVETDMLPDANDRKGGFGSTGK